MIVMENPIQFTIVNEVPLDSSATFCAISVEKSGESAMTTNPQKNKKLISIPVELLNKNKGESKQQQQDRNNAMVAIFFAPKRCEIIPPAAQAKAPDAMIKKDKKEISSLLW